MKLRIVVQAAAAKFLVAVGNGPRNDVAIRVVIEVQIKRDGIIEADILRVQRFSLQHAGRKRDDRTILAPDEEPNLVRHQSAEAAEILLGQLLEVQLRSVVD